MGGSINKNVFVYTHNGGSLVTSSIGFKTNICDSPKNNSGGLEFEYVWVTHLVVHQKNSRYSLHTDGWFTKN